MLDRLRDLDRILRGEATHPAILREGPIRLDVGRLVPLLALLGAGYGLCMGAFSLVNHGQPELRQLLASALKVPGLFLTALLVTFPSLYVFNALVGSRLTPVSLARLLTASLAVTLAVLSSLGPIVGFFSLTTESYPFMKLLNVLVFAASGALGLVFLARTLGRLTASHEEAERQAALASPPVPSPAPESAATPALEVAAPPSDTAAPPRRGPAPGPLDGAGPLLGPHLRVVFAVWMVVFGLVGAQLSWVLRPFIGDPTRPFTWFRPRESNFFLAVWDALRSLLS